MPHTQLFLSFLILGLAAAGCSERPTVTPSVTAQQQMDAARSMRLTFPSATKYLLYHRDSDGPDDAVWLKIELPAGSLPTLLGEPTLAAAAWSAKYPFVHDVPGWPEWEPSKVSQFRSAQIALPKAEFMKILIDESRQDVRVVYLLWHQT